ncbi:MAG TPA: EamA family transporter, partial [Abditibacteriaceae bacterium]
NVRGEVAKLDGKSLGLLVISGVVSCFAYMSYFGALSLGNSSRVQPLDRISLVFAIVLAALFLREKVNSQVIAGAGLMVLGAIMVAAANPGK